ncbi:MAG: ion channel [Flavipsychrobacter sp.]|nr:ion channel [Flavipsychrobacter sp.]
MAIDKLKSIDPKLKANNDTGFGVITGENAGRFVNKDGTFNLKRVGISFVNRFSIYQQMLNLPRWKFVGIIFLFYFVINVLFTLAYMVAGVSELQGLTCTTNWGKYKELFFFSCQTFTTVGYGRINPLGDWANLIAAIEALTGFLSFALATGLIFGRFAKPRSYLMFSNMALISPYKNITALTFRFVTYKDNHVLTNVEIKVNIALKVPEDGKDVYKFYDLALERYKVDSLPLNWTVVHPIDESSPIAGFNYQDMVNADVEIYVLITGFDAVYSSPVLQRTSYTYQEMKFNAKFVPMYHDSADGQTTILEMHKLNQIKILEEKKV